MVVLEEESVSYVVDVRHTERERVCVCARACVRVYVMYTSFFFTIATIMILLSEFQVCGR